MTKTVELIYDKINNTCTTHGATLLLNILCGSNDKIFNINDVVKTVKENTALKNKVCKYLRKYNSCETEDKLNSLMKKQKQKKYNIPFINKVNKYFLIIIVAVYFLLFLVLCDIILKKNDDISIMNCLKHIFNEHKLLFSEITNKISSENSFNDFCCDIISLLCIFTHILILYSASCGFFIYVNNKSNKFIKEFRNIIDTADKIIDNDIFTRDELLKKQTRDAINTLNDIFYNENLWINDIDYYVINDNINVINNYIAEFDVQLMLSDMVITKRYCIPEFMDDDGNDIYITKMFNPLHYMHNDDIIKNDFIINKKSNENLFIIGGACGKGKSYYVQSIYFCVWMSHVLNIAPCASIKLHKYDYILNIKQHDSSVSDIKQFEDVREVVLSSANKKIFLVNDNNLCKNLSFQENVAILYSFYNTLIKYKNLTGIVTTNNNPHYMCDNNNIGNSIQIYNFDDVGVIRSGNKNNFNLDVISSLEKKYSKDDELVKMAKQKLKILPK